MHKSDIFLIFSPFVLIFISAAFFLFFQFFLKKKYFLNLMISIFLIFFLILIFLYKFNSNFSDNQIFYLISAYLCNAFIFMNLIQTCISSLQLAVLRIVYLNPSISKKEIIKKYNSKHIFEERVKRLELAGIIYKKKTSFFLKNTKILLVLNFFLILNKIFYINKN